MRRSTTPIHKFTCPTDPALYEKILITYAQHGEVVLEKKKTDLTISGNQIIVNLSEEESNLFNPRSKAKVQLKVQTYTNQVYASPIFEFNVEEVLNDDVFTE